MAQQAAVIDFQTYRAQRRQEQRRAELPRPRFEYVFIPWFNPFAYQAGLMWQIAAAQQREQRG